LEWRITQCSRPSRVLDFIKSQPGLRAMVESRVDYLLFYAPQLGIPGVAGFLEPVIESIFRKAQTSIRAHPTSGAPGWALRDPDLCHLHPDNLVEQYFWPSDPAGTSPEADVLAWVDAAAWIASSESDWLPSQIKSGLREGLGSSVLLARMHRGDVDIWDVKDSKPWVELMYHGPKTRDRTDFAREACRLFEERVAVSREMIGLPESPVELVDRIACWGVFDKYWTYMASR